MEATLTFTVTDDDTADALGSGSLPVLGTPRLLAWAEAATCAAIDPVLEAGTTSVGARVSLQHLAPSPVGTDVMVTARTTSREGRDVAFVVEATHADGTVVGRGSVGRVVVETDRFLARLA